LRIWMVARKPSRSDRDPQIARPGSVGACYHFFGLKELWRRTRTTAPWTNGGTVATRRRKRWNARKAALS
jgi:hypothetical protein